MLGNTVRDIIRGEKHFHNFWNSISKLYRISINNNKKITNTNFIELCYTIQEDDLRLKTETVYVLIESINERHKVKNLCCL